jgi:hypothetical protein
VSDDLAATLRAIIERLEALGIGYMVVGSVAALAHGHSRTTQDFDVVVQAGGEQLRAFVRSLPAGRYYASEDAAIDAARLSTLFNVIDLGTGWKVDVIPLKRRPFSQREFGRRRAVELLGLQVRVASVEDVIVAKLEWSVMGGGSTRQLDDVKALIRLSGAALDRAYIEQACDELGLADAWLNVSA